MTSDMKQHLNGPGSCPFCDSTELTLYDWDALADTAWQRVECDDCGKELDDIYTLQGYKEAN